MPSSIDMNERQSAKLDRLAERQGERSSATLTNPDAASTAQLVPTTGPGRTRHAMSATSQPTSSDSVPQMIAASCQAGATAGLAVAPFDIG